MKQIVIIFLALLLPGTVFAQYKLNIKDHYSPRNSRCSKRAKTNMIVLHTTEAGDRSSLHSVTRKAAANYLVMRDGTVFRTVDKGRIANHAGISMWKGKTSLSLTSIGIEVVGHHDKPITPAQKRALKELLRQLMDIYNIPAKMVVTHSMVAYGHPNRWQKKDHRGRKRCAMLFATQELRKELGLYNIFTHDPDVDARRLVQADPALAKVLYAGGPPFASQQCPCVIQKDITPWTIARERYADATTIYEFPMGEKYRGDQITDWGDIPIGTIVTFEKEGYIAEGASDGFKIYPKDGTTAWAIAGENYASKETIYFLPSGSIIRGDLMKKSMLDRLPNGTKILTGYIYGGHISPKRSAYSIAKEAWNLPSTIYHLPNGITVNGDTMTEHKIPGGSLIFVRK